MSSQQNKHDLVNTPAANQWHELGLSSVEGVYCNPGKTRRARALAHYYNTPVLLVDDVVTEALYYSGSSAAVAARLMCTEAAAHAIEPSLVSDDKPDKPGHVHRSARMYLPAAVIIIHCCRCTWTSLTLGMIYYDTS